MTINEIQDEIIEEFNSFDNWMDRYQVIIEYGKELPAFSPELMTDKNLIDGCQSQVWFTAELKEGKVIYSAYSEALLVKGIVALLIHVLSGHTPEEITQAELYFIKEIQLQEHLSPTRNNGIVAMLQQMKLFALAFQSAGQK